MSGFAGRSSASTPPLAKNGSFGTVPDEMGGDRSSDECDEEEDRDEHPSGERELVLLEPQPDARPVAARLDSRPAVVLLDALRRDEVVGERRPHAVGAPGGNRR